MKANFSVDKILFNLLNGTDKQSVMLQNRVVLKISQLLDFTS